MYSPDPPGIDSIGTKAATVVRVEVSIGMASPSAPLATASRRDLPWRMSTSALSDTTIALSTIIPSAMISEAIENCSSSTPKRRTTANELIMHKGTAVAITTAARQPIISSATRSTIRIASHRLMTKPVTRPETWRGMSLIRVSLMSGGSSVPRMPSTAASICSPISTMFCPDFIVRPTSSARSARSSGEMKRVR